MKVLRIVLAISALACLGAGRASAGMVAMYSGPDADYPLTCSITNVGKKDIIGQISGLYYDGSLADTPQDFALPPGRGASVPISGFAATCKVVLVSGKAKDVRGAAIYHAGTDGAYSIPIQ